ncbi:uncharacterized protein LOC109538609 [Dendroctonus ponderosae]|uniref:uncharacterized protein LOC109538609 n=1 Tax=Dendroctonus ponderosae TaxID=77166 RepID=UPI00203545FF|nr:uncharacterized protein LOC109538609 [Dendroctonus ponderosae]KAH1024588.1 hypothetical protein HUJ05_004050 [Dendroctonus ponderosae]
MDLFRKLFGLPPQPYNSPNFDQENTSIKPPENGRNFNIFTDPLEMHRYLEQQMDMLATSFGMLNFGHLFGALEKFHGDDPYQEEGFSPNSRDSFLNTDYESPSYEYPSNSGKADKDLDGKLNLTELDALFNKPDERETGFAGGNPFGRSSGTFKKSVEVRTVLSPDGSYKLQKIVIDSEGNKETTVTKIIDDKEYTTIRRQYMDH